MRRKMEFNDFEPYFWLKSRYYYIPTEKTRILHEKMGITDSNWLFDVKKKDVFKYLNWKQDFARTTHFNATGFPEFDTETEATMFLLTAILLHNEAITK